MVAETSLICEGGLEEVRYFADEYLFENYLEKLEQEFSQNTFCGELYVLWHDHDALDADCNCSESAQDHKPYRVYNETR